MTNWTGIFGGIALGCIAVHEVVVAFLLAKLRVEEPGMFEALGSPKFGELRSRWPSKMSKQWRFTKFLLSGVYLQANSTAVAVLGSIAVVSLSGIIIGFICLAIVYSKG